MFFRSCLVISLSVLSAAEGNLRASQNSSHQNASHAQRDGDRLGDWRWNATEMAAENMSKAGWAAPPRAHGFRFMATSTRYGTNPHTSCGLDSAALVQGTDYLAVASAQAMQDGCCWCNRNGGGGATASMGCGACGKGRFIRQLPRGFHVWTPSDAEIFQKVYKFVVVDICPKVDNGMWCPMHPGQKNTFGVYNHFDFATVPPKFDNFYFEFTPEPCDGEMQARLRRMSSCGL